MPLPPWPFPIDWTSGDTRAVVQNLVASLVLIGVGDVLARALLSVVFGPSSRLRIEPGPDQNLPDVDWPFLRVTNKGLPLAPRTRAALGVIAYATIDGSAVRLNWSTSGPVPLERADIYGGRSDDLPLVARANKNVNAVLYRWVLQAQTAYLTEVTFLTQGPANGAVAQHPLAYGQHSLQLTVQSLDGARKSAEFTINIPPWPGRITLQKKAGRWPWN